MNRLKTRLTEVLQIEHPIVCGGMFRLGRAELAAAISNAGGLGIITSATFPSADELVEEIRLLKSLTPKPFGVNINLFPTTRGPAAGDYLAASLREGVPVFETSGRSPEPYLRSIHDAGAKLIHKVAGAQYAKTAERLGCDVVSVVGNETGGHPGMADVGTIVMVRQAAETVGIPIIAGGGFGDGAGLLAALALGAEGIVMGTRFLATAECAVHPAVKTWMVDARADDTTIIQKSIGSPMRVAKNAMASRVVTMEQEGANLEQLLPFITGSRNPTVYSEGNLDDAVWSCGQAVGLVNDIPTCRELIERIVADAIASLRRLDTLRVGSPELV
ncbi:nitronate monooxygenase family protein [Pararhizobium sp. YC-54]|uniref:NAD(P)H-dependent flavin oxidoreductase n=1 Tax=Pararhizobium sp. YC-54 TaxID=2986920 RepID=UPI0021F7DEAA|nr:nitronate monooxygenase family protein [Pararhizobium sp. YC-54]MCW0001576.1 nitronate monooxygenase family protein [Pararhizobium sp. YC-54]